MSRAPRVGLAAMFHSQLGIAGGLDIYVRQLVEALAEHDRLTDYVVLTTAKGAEAWAYRSWPINFTIHALREFAPRPAWPRRVINHYRRRRGLPVPPHYGDDYLAWQIDELGLDLVHFPATLIRPLTLQTPCVLTVFDIQHVYYPEFFTPAELAWREQNYGPSIKKAVRLLAPSAYTAASLTEKYAVPPERLSLIPVGADPGVERASPGEAARVRAKYQLPERYIYYPANPWPHKNHARLIAALRRLRGGPANPPALVLSGRLVNELRDARQLALAADMDAHVLDLGFVPPADLAGLYTGAELLVFPSLFEGFGIPLLEAMACGCPIAAANATAIPECVGDAALLFDPLDPDSIASALRTMLDDAALRQTLAARGTARLRAFAWPAIVAQLSVVYAHVAEAAHAGRL
ncbi:MAG: glycosyltransferase family 4 protein [Anaerolineales bacterium]|nr:glycosyltransferase family 4 protein [Anaerolineales bacterium]